MDGCQALFTRALAQAKTEHGVLAKIQLRPRSDPYVVGVAETIAAHGEPATAGGLESILVRIVELLGRLIGDDMTMRLIGQSLTGNQRSVNESRGEEE